MKCAAVSIALVSSGAVASQLRASRQEDRYASFQTAVIEGDKTPSYDADWYSEQCAKINDQCEERKAQKIRDYEEDLAELKAEWTAQKNILATKEAKHKDEKADVSPQAKKVAEERKDVQKARTDVKEKAHCPPDLKVAESRLAALEAQPNKTPQDIDEECELQKKIVKLKACVEEFRAAELVLAKEQDEHRDENGELKEESAEESDAASAVPPQKARTADAQAAYESFKRRGVRGIAAINSDCQAERDALERKADDDIAQIADAHSTQKSILGDKVGFHKQQQADVVSQKDRVVREQKDVPPAQKTVAEYDHCPPELEVAQGQLDKLEAKPNKTPQDVDEECALKVKIMKLKDCVKQWEAAKEVLSKEVVQYHRENAVLNKEQGEEGEASVKVPPQKGIVGDLESALAAAKEARKSICLGPDELKKPAPAPAPAPAQKSGAAEKASSTTTVLAIFAVVLASMQA